MGCACSAAGSAASSASPEDVARTEHGQGRVLDRWNGRAGDLARVSRTFVEAKGDLETLDRDAFVKLFDLHDFPAAAVDAAFRVFDKDGSGAVDFQELCYALSLCFLSGQEERLRFLFNMFDTSGRGIMSQAQAAALLQAALKSLQQFGLAPTSAHGDDSERLWLEQQLAALQDCMPPPTGGAPSAPPGSVTFDAFRQWAGRGPAADHMLKAFDVLPSPRKQRLAVKVALGCAGFRSADVWYVLPSAWWRQWAQFTAFHEVDDRRELAEELLPHWGGGLRQAPPGEEGGDAPPLNPATNIPPGCGVPFVHEAYRVVHELPAAGGAKEAKEEEEEEEEVPAPVLVPSSPPVRQVSVGHGGVMPGPIDCSALLAPAPSASASPRQLSAELRSGLVPDYDFVLLPATVWRLFVRWYGLAKGVGAVPRRVLCDAGALSVELYPPVLTFLLAAHDGRPDPRTEVSVMVSRSTPLAALHALARQEFGYHPLPLPSDPPHAGALVQALRTTCHAQPAAQPVQLFLQEFSPCPWQAAEPLALQVASPTKPPSVTARTISSSDVARLRSRLWLALPQADAADNPPWRRLHPCPSTVLQQHIAALAQGAATDCLPALHAGNTPIALAGLGSGSRLMLEVAMPPQAHARDLHAKAFSASFGWFWPCALLDCEAWAEDDRPGMVPASQEVHIPLPRIPVPDAAEGVDEGTPARCPAGTVLLHAPVSSWRYGRWAAPWMSHPLPPQKSPGLLAGGSVKVFEVLPPPLPVPQAVDVLVDGQWQAGNVAAAPSEAASQSPWRLKVLGSKRGSPATEVHVPPEQVHVAPPGWRCATPPFTGKRWGPGHSKHGATVARAWRAVLQREDTLKGGAKRAKGKAWWEGLWWARRPRKSAARERPKKVGPGRETTTTAQFADTAEGSATQVVPLASAHTAHHRRAGMGHGGKDGGSVQSSVHSAVSGASAAKAGSVDTAASSRKEAGTVGSTGSAAGGEESGRASGCAGFSQQPTDVLEEHAWRAGTDPDLWGFDTAAFLWGEEGHLAAEGEEAPSAEALVLRSRWWVVRVAEEWAVHVDMAPAMQSSSEGSAKLLAATTSNSATAAVAQGELWGTGGGVVLQGNHRQSRLLGGATGLANLGNTCYMNVILQCLAATPLLNRFMSSGNFRPEVNSSNPLGSGGRLARTLGELLHVMWAGTHKWVSPSSFKEALTTAKPWFAGREQHDAMELLGQLLDCLHEDLSRVSTKQRDEVLAARRRVSKSQRQAKQPTEGSKGTARAGGAPPPAFEGAHVTSEMTSVPRDAEGGRPTPSPAGIASAGGPPHSVERVASNTEAKDAPPTLTFDAAAPDIPDGQGESKHAYDSKEDEPSPRPPPSGRGPSLAHPLDVSACVHDAVGHRLGRSGSLASVDLSGVPPSSDGQGHEPVGVALGEYSLLKSDPATLLSHAEAANQSWVQHLLLNRSAVVDLFQGQYQARTVCQHCRWSDAGQTLVRIHFDYFPVKWDETFVLPSTKLAVLGRHTASACLLPQPFAVPEAGLSVAFASPAASTTASSKKTRLQEALVAVQVVHRFPQHRTVRRTTRREVEIVTPTKVSLPDRSGAAKSETRTSRTMQWQDVTEDQRVTSWHCFGQPLMLHFSSLLSSCQVAELVAAHAGRFMASNISEAPAQQLADGTAATLASYSSEYLSLMKTVAAASSVEGQGSRGDAQALSTSDHADDQQQNASVLTAVELRLECVKRLFSHAPFELRLVSERDLASSSKGTLLKPSVQPLNLLKGSSIAVHWHDPAAYSAVAPLFSCVGLVPAPPCLLSKHLVQRLRASGVLGQASASEDECTALAAAAHQAVRGNLAVGAAAVPVVLLGSTQQVLPEGVELAPAVVTALQSAEGGEAANHSLLPSCGSTAVHASLGQVRALQAHRLQRRAGEGAPPSPACESTPSQWVGNPATTISLESCFDAFTKVEKLPAWRCEQCSETGGVRSTALWRLPDILVLQLARFRFNEFEREKLHHPIAFPVDHMNVAPWVAPAPLLHEALSGEAAGNGPPQRLAQSSSTASAPSFAEMPTDFTNMLRAEYDLYAVVHHHGQMGSGHYTAVCKVPLSGDGGDGDAWLRFDDRHVEAAPDPSECISPSAAYVLFYRRRHLSPRNVISLKGAGIA